MKRAWWGWFATGLALWLVAALGSEGARAEEPRAASFSWVRLDDSDACGSARQIAASVEGLLGQQALVPATRAELFIEGHVTRAGEAYRAQLRMSDAAGVSLGTRVLEDADCAELTRAVGLAVAVMIDPDAALREPPPGDAVVGEAVVGDAPASEPAAEVTTPESEPQQSSGRDGEPAAELMAPAMHSSPPVDAESRWELGLRAGVAFLFGGLPNVPWGGAMTLYVTPPGFVPVEIEGVLLADQSDEIRAGAGADLSFVLGGVALCPLVLAPGPAEVRGCLGAQVGSIRSNGFGFDVSNDAEALYGAALLRVRAAIEIAGPFRLSTAAALVVPLVRERFFATTSIGEERELFRVAPLLGQLELGLELRFF